MGKTTHCIHSIDNIHKMIPQNNIDPKQQYLNQQYGKINNKNDDLLKLTTSKISIRTIIENPSNKDEVCVILSNNSYIVYLLNVKTGKLIKKIESEKLKTYLFKKQQKKSNSMTNPNALERDFFFSNIAVSAYGQYLYVLGEPDHILYCFNTLKTSKKKKNDLLVNAIKIHEKDVICLAMHPHRNIMSSIGSDRKLKIWRP